jgi:hypothetical protein
MTLADAYAEFAAAAVPMNTPEVVRSRIVMAYYHGALFVLTILSRIAGPNWHRNETRRVIRGIVEEAAAFNESVIKGGSKPR